MGLDFLLGFLEWMGFSVVVFFSLSFPKLFSPFLWILDVAPPFSFSSGFSLIYRDELKCGVRLIVACAGVWSVQGDRE